MKKIILLVSLCFSINSFAQDEMQRMNCEGAISEAIFSYNNYKIQSAGKDYADAVQTGDDVKKEEAQNRRRSYLKQTAGLASAAAQIACVELQ
ncbi:MAG: hypothetical protein WA160_00765 [Pseudobdellovibrio sp.]